MRKNAKITFFKRSVLLILILGSVSAVSNDRFQEVIDNAGNQTIKDKLIAFKKGGIEFAVNTNEYDAEKVISLAESYLGTPHKMGGTTNDGIDCSGLMMIVHAKYDVLLPHSSHEQARFGMIIPQRSDLERGDLVFFYNSYTTKNFITHSGIYLGYGNFIHTSTSKGVMVSEMNDGYWSERYLFATRLKN